MSGQNFRSTPVGWAEFGMHQQKMLTSDRAGIPCGNLYNMSVFQKCGVYTGHYESLGLEHCHQMHQNLVPECSEALPDTGQDGLLLLRLRAHVDE